MNRISWLPLSKIFRIFLSVAIVFVTTPSFADHDDPSTIDFADPEVGAVSTSIDAAQHHQHIELSPQFIGDVHSADVAEGWTAHFHNPSVALLRVISGLPTNILGNILAPTTDLTLVNFFGIFFGPNSHVDVASIMASTLNITNDDFLAGNYHFYKEEGSPDASVVNEGTIRAERLIAFIGSALANHGLMQATLGSVVLAAGEALTLNLESDSLISVVIAESVKAAVLGENAAVKNTGEILAEGGRVLLTAKVLNQVFDHAVNNSGIIEATTMVDRAGSIELVAEGENSQLVNSGRLAADLIHVSSEGSIRFGGEIQGDLIDITANGYLSVESLVLTNGNLSITNNGIGFDTYIYDLFIDNRGSDQLGQLTVNADGNIYGNTTNNYKYSLEVYNTNVDIINTGESGNTTLYDYYVDNRGSGELGHFNVTTSGTLNIDSSYTLHGLEAYDTNIEITNNGVSRDTYLYDLYADNRGSGQQGQFNITTNGYLRISTDYNFQGIEAYNADVKITNNSDSSTNLYDLYVNNSQSEGLGFFSVTSNGSINIDSSYTLRGLEAYDTHITITNNGLSTSTNLYDFYVDNRTSGEQGDITIATDGQLYISYDYSSYGLEAYNADVEITNNSDSSTTLYDLYLNNSQSEALGSFTVTTNGYTAIRNSNSQYGLEAFDTNITIINNGASQSTNLYDFLIDNRISGQLGDISVTANGQININASNSFQGIEAYNANILITNSGVGESTYIYDVLLDNSQSDERGLYEVTTNGNLNIEASNSRYGIKALNTNVEITNTGGGGTYVRDVNIDNSRTGGLGSFTLTTNGYTAIEYNYSSYGLQVYDTNVVINNNGVGQETRLYDLYADNRSSGELGEIAITTDGYLEIDVRNAYYGIEGYNTNVEINNISAETRVFDVYLDNSENLTGRGSFAVTSNVYTDVEFIEALNTNITITNTSATENTNLVSFSTTNGDITLIADHFTFVSGDIFNSNEIESNTGNITLANFSGGLTLDVGFAGESNIQFGEEVLNLLFTSGTITFGSETAGTITVGGAIDAPSMNIAFISGDTIVDIIGNGPIVADSLTLSAANGIGSEENPFDTEVVTLSAGVTAEGAGIFINEFDAVVISSIAGSQFNGGAIELVAGGDISILEQTISGTATFFASGNITIDGDVTVSGGSALNLYADHLSEEEDDWHDGIGTITRSGNFTIFGGEILLSSANIKLLAGSGIGTANAPIQISGDIYLTAEINDINGSGGIYISKNDGLQLTIQQISTRNGDISINTAGYLSVHNLSTTNGDVTIINNGVGSNTNIYDLYLDNRGESELGELVITSNGYLYMAGSNSPNSLEVYNANVTLTNNSEGGPSYLYDLKIDNGMSDLPGLLTVSTDGFLEIKAAHSGSYGIKAYNTNVEITNTSTDETYVWDLFLDNRGGAELGRFDLTANGYTDIKYNHSDYGIEAYDTNIEITNTGTDGTYLYDLWIDNRGSDALGQITVTTNGYTSIKNYNTKYGIRTFNSNVTITNNSAQGTDLDDIFIDNQGSVGMGLYNVTVNGSLTMDSNNYSSNSVRAVNTNVDITNNSTSSTYIYDVLMDNRDSGELGSFDLTTNGYTSFDYDYSNYGLRVYDTNVTMTNNGEFARTNLYDIYTDNRASGQLGTFDLTTNGSIYIDVDYNYRSIDSYNTRFDFTNNSSDSFEMYDARVDNRYSGGELGDFDITTNGSVYIDASYAYHGLQVYDTNIAITNNGVSEDTTLYDLYMDNRASGQLGTFALTTNGEIYIDYDYSYRGLETYNTNIEITNNSTDNSTYLYDVFQDNRASTERGLYNVTVDDYLRISGNYGYLGIDAYNTNVEITNNSDGATYIYDAYLDNRKGDSLGSFTVTTNGYTNLRASGSSYSLQAYNSNVEITSENNEPNGRAYIEVSGPISITGTGSIKLTARNTVSYDVDINAGDNFENYAKIIVNNTITTEDGNIILEATNDVTRNILGYSSNSFYDNSRNYAYIDINAAIEAGGSGYIDIDASNSLTTTSDLGAYDYYDYSDNYAEIQTNGEISSVSGAIELTTDNSVTRNISSDSINYYYDYSSNYGRIYVYDRIYTTSAATNEGAITLISTNWVDNTLTVEGDINGGYYDDSYSDAYISINNSSDDPISTNAGNISITTDNSLTRDISAYYMAYFYLGPDSPDVYSKIKVSNTDITSATGSITLSATNTVDNTVFASNPVDDGAGNISYEGGIDNYYDNSHNYAEVNINNGGDFSTISTEGDILITATNTVNPASDGPDITADYIGDYRDNSENNAYLYIYDALTTDPESTGLTLGTITLKAINDVANTIDVTNGEITTYNDRSSNYAYINALRDISSSDGNITLEATNDVTRNITGYASDSFYDYIQTYAKIDINGSIEVTGSGYIDIDASNSLTTTSDLGAYDYYDYSDNYAQINVNSDLSVKDNSIDLYAVNTNNRSIANDPQTYEYDYFEDQFTNYAAIYANSTIKILGPTTDKRNISLKAENNFTDVSFDRVGYEYDDYGSYNYAEIYTDYEISTPNGDITLTAQNTVKRQGPDDEDGNPTQGAAYYDYYYYGYDESPYNYAYLNIEGQIKTYDLGAEEANENKGILTLTATNTIEDNVDRGSYYDGYSEYYDYSYNYADIDIYNSLDADGNIYISSDNDVTKSGALEYDYIEDSSDNYAEIQTNGEISSASGRIELTADDFVINNSISSDSGDIILANASSGRLIALGYSSGSDDMEIDGDEIGLISTTSGTITIGSETAGTITVGGTADFGIQDVELISGDTIVDVSGVETIIANVLNLSAVNGIGTSGNPLDIQINTLSAETSDGSIYIRQEGDLSVDTINTAGVNADVNLTLAGADNTLTLSGNVTAAGNITYTADNMVLGGTSDAGANTITLVSFTGGREIDLGTDTEGKLSLTDSEIDTITAGAIYIGSADSGTITVSDTISVDSASLYLTSGDSIIDAPDVGTIIGNSLTLSTGAGIGSVENPFSIQVQTLDAQITGSGGIYLEQNSDQSLTISSVSTQGGDISIESSGNLTVQSLSLTNGNLNLTNNGDGYETYLYDLLVDNRDRAEQGQITITTNGYTTLQAQDNSYSLEAYHTNIEITNNGVGYSTNIYDVYLDNRIDGVGHGTLKITTDGYTQLRGIKVYNSDIDLTQSASNNLNIYDIYMDNQSSPQRGLLSITSDSYTYMEAWNNNYAIEAYNANIEITNNGEGQTTEIYDIYLDNSTSGELGSFRLTTNGYTYLDSYWSYYSLEAYNTNVAITNNSGDETDLYDFYLDNRGADFTGLLKILANGYLDIGYNTSDYAIDAYNTNVEITNNGSGENTYLYDVYLDNRSYTFDSEQASWVLSGEQISENGTFQVTTQGYTSIEYLDLYNTHITIENGSPNGDNTYLYNLYTSQGNISITGDSFSIGGGITTDSGDITIANYSAGKTFDIGFAGGSNIVLDSNTLNQLSATGTYTFGSETAGQITMGALDFGDHGLKLLSGDMIVDLVGEMVIGNNLTLSAGAGIGSLENPFSIQVQTLDAEVTGSGGIYLEQNSDQSLTISSISTPEGDISLIADSFTISGGVTTDSGNITIANYSAGRTFAIGFSGEAGIVLDENALDQLSATGTYTFGSETAGQLTVGALDFGDHGLKLLSGNMIVDLAGTQTIVAGTLTLSAALGIGTSDNLLNIEVATLNAETTGDGASIYIDETGEIVVGSLSAGSSGDRGTVTLTAGGTITDLEETIIAETLTLSAAEGIGSSDNLLNIEVATLNAETTGGGAGIYLEETDDLVVGIISAGTFETRGLVSLTAGGTITDLVEGTITAETLTLTSATGIGTSDNLLNIEVVMLNAETTGGGAGIYIDEMNDLAVDALIAGTAEERGLVSLTAGGTITDLGESEAIIADVLTLSAADGIGTSENPFNTQVATLSAHTTADGAGIFIDELDGVELVDLDTLNGNIGILTQGDTVVTDVQIDGTSGAIGIASSGENLFTLGTLSAPEGIVIGTLGAVIDDGDTETVISSALVSLIAGTGIGSLESAVDTQASDLILLTGVGDIVVNQTGPTDTLAALTGIGDILIEASGDVAGAGLVALIGNVSLTATGDITVDAIGGFEVDVVAGGSINDLDDVVTVIADTLVLEAANGIGAADNLLNIEVNALSAKVTEAGADIYIDETDDLVVDTISAGTLENRGTVSLTAGGAVTDLGEPIVADVLSITAGTGIGTSDNLLNIEVAMLNAETTGDGADIYIDESDDLVVDAISAGTLENRGTVSLTAGGTITDLGEPIAADVLSITAGTGIGTSDNLLNIEVATLNAETTGDGASIYIDETGEIVVGSLSAGSSGDRGTVTLTAGGTITDLEETIIAETLTLSASEGIGTSDNLLNIEVATLNAETTGDGAGIYLEETDDLVVGIISAGTFETRGTISLTAGGTITDLVEGTITAETLTLTSATGIGTSDNLLNIEVATLNAETTGDGADIYIDESDDLVVDAISAGTLENRGTVSLTAGGAITDLGEPIVADVLSLSAGTGIGTSDNLLNIKVATLNAETTVSGGIYIEQNSDQSLTISSISTPEGDIILTADSFTISGGVTTDSGDITIANYSAGRTFDIGFSGGSGIVLDSGALNQLSATGTYTFGSETAGQITMGALDFGDHGLKLLSGDTIVDLVGETVIGNNLTLSAGAGIGSVENPFSIQVQTLDAEVTGLGGIYIEQNSDQSLTISSISTPEGDISLTADSFTISGGVTTDSGDITIANYSAGRTFAIGFSGEAGIVLDSDVLNQLSATGTYTLGSETAGQITVGDINFGDLALKLLSGDTIVDLAGTQTIVAGTLTLSSALGIGTSDNFLNIEVNTLNAETTGDGADIYIDETDDLVVDMISAGTADERGLVSLTTGGAVTDLVGGTITADTLTLTATTGIGSSDNLLNIEVNTLNAETTGSGGIYLEQNSDQSLTISSILTPEGDISLIADSFTISGGVTTDSGDITIANYSAGRTFDIGFSGGSSDIVLDEGVLNQLSATGTYTFGSETAGQITVGTINFGDQALKLLSGDTIADLEGGEAIVAGTLTLSAILGIGTNDNLLNIEVATLNAETTGAGADIYIDETNDLIVGTLSAGTSDDRGGIELTAGGTITDLGESEAIIADVLTLSAASGIGTSGNLLDITVNTLSAEGTDAGADIYIDETNDLIVGTLSAGTSDDRGDIELTAGGTITNLGESESILADVLTLSAASGIGTSDNLLNITVNILSAEATDAGADIYIDETDELIVDTITAGTANNRGTVKLTAGGAITDLGATVIADDLTLTASGSGIGTASNPLNTQVNTLTAEATAAGSNIFIDDLDGITVGTATAGGELKITADGASIFGHITTDGNLNVMTSSGLLQILSGTLTSNNGGVTVQNTGGDVVAVGTGSHIQAATGSSIQSAGAIGSSTVPLNVAVTSGNLEISVGSTTVASGIKSTLSSGTIVVSSTSVAKGGLALSSVSANGAFTFVPVSTGVTPALISETANLLSVLPPARNSAVSPLVEISGPVFLYHPLGSSVDPRTGADWSAFDELILEEAAYEFIDGEIKAAAARP